MDFWLDILQRWERVFITMAIGKEIVKATEGRTPYQKTFIHKARLEISHIMNAQ